MGHGKVGINVSVESLEEQVGRKAFPKERLHLAVERAKERLGFRVLAENRSDFPIEGIGPSRPGDLGHFYPAIYILDVELARRVLHPDLAVVDRSQEEPG